MNIKTLAWIIIVLIVAAIAIQLFVPKKYNADGSITTFGKSAQDTGDNGASEKSTEE